MRKHERLAGLALRLFLISSSVLLSGCTVKETPISGETMGTTYRVQLAAGRSRGLSALRREIAERLEEINRSMSTYMEESEISRFNAISSTAEAQPISEDFYNVLTMAAELYRLTGGAWDGTLKPLVNLWGFGSTKGERRIPGEAEIEECLENVGFHLIEISDDRHIRKRNPDLGINLGSIAKGYAVDQVAALIRSHGITDFLVEIGGEVFASGQRQDAEKWRVGINLPLKDAPYDSVYRVVALRDRAIATSGDYRDYFVIDGKHYSHVFDPRTGRPVAHGVMSVSVLADSCAFADGLATAAMVLGPARALELVNGLDGVECLIIYRGENGALAESYSTGFRLAHAPLNPG